MSHHHRTLSLATVTLLLSLISPVLPFVSIPSYQVAQAQTVEDRRSEALRLYEEGRQLLNKGQFREALETFQAALLIVREIGERQGEGVILSSIGLAYHNLGKYQEALDYYQKALAIKTEISDHAGVGTTLNNIGGVYYDLGQYTQALEYYQQALVIHVEVGNRPMEGTTFNNIGAIYRNLSEYTQALEYYQKALAISTEIGDRAGEGGTLSNIGVVYSQLGQYQQALEYYKQALVIRNEISDRRGEGRTLNNIGGVYHKLGQYQEALEYYQQAWVIVTEIDDRTGQGTTLSNIGLVYSELGQYQQALHYYRQALAIQTEIGDHAGEGTTLSKIGGVFANLGQYQYALRYYQQALAIRTEIGDLNGEAVTLNNIGLVHSQLGQYQQALEYYQQALTIVTEIGDRPGEGATLNNIGMVYQYLGKYQQALDYYQQALAIVTKIGNRNGEAGTLNNFGMVYQSIGKYQQALEYHQQALAIVTEIGNRNGEGTTLNNIGSVYQYLGKYQQALEYYQQALAISIEIGDRAGEGYTLNNIGMVYQYLGKHQEALEEFQQALAIRTEIGDRNGEAVTLNNIGGVYESLERYQQALEYFQQALAIHTEIGDRAGEEKTLNNIGYTLEAQNQPELAIIFYKKSVNITEAIRDDIKGLSQEQQQSYTETVVSTYRRLADLLLQQNRILEAQRVLDLLKVQELDDYLRNLRGNQDTAQGIETLPPEQQIFAEYNQLQNQAIAIGKELTQLRQIPEAEWTPAQAQRIAELVTQQGQLKRLFVEFTKRSDVVALVNQLSQTAKEQSLQLSRLTNISDNLRQLNQNAVLLYPLILEDRLELVLTSPDSPPIRRTVEVTQEELNRAIVQFRQALQDPYSDAITPARQLYDWLIKPLENDLSTADAQTIIYAPDGQLRYIPLAALHDGTNWLVERFRINNITADSLTDFDNSPQNQLRILAGAFTQGRYSFSIGDEQFTFGGLPFAGKEVDILAETVPDTTKFIDQDFSKTTILPRMDNYSIVHFATHGALVQGLPEESFILLGNGDRISMRDVQNTWFLTNVDLIVLSACETGLGGQFGTGEEILGFGYLMQNAGARAAIASLWQVSDGGTQALMNAFYAALQGDNMTKAEALRQAQIALITNNYDALGEERGGIVVVRLREGLPEKVVNHLSHPYYWSPFILIGNGL